MAEKTSAELTQTIQDAKSWYTVLTGLASKGFLAFLLVAMLVTKYAIGSPDPAVQIAGYVTLTWVGVAYILGEALKRVAQSIAAAWMGTATIP